MQSRIQSSANKSNVSINTTLVAKKQTAQSVKASPAESYDPKLNFNLGNIAISSPHKPSQPPPKINPKLGNLDSLNSEKRETKQNKPETAIKIFAPSNPLQPRKKDPTKKQFQPSKLRAKFDSQQSSLNLRRKLQPKSASSLHLDRTLVSDHRLSSQTFPVQPKLKVAIPPRNRLQQQIAQRKEETPTEEVSHKPTTSPSTPPNDSSVQTKLTISTPGNQYEQEADTVTVAAREVGKINPHNNTTVEGASLVQSQARQKLLPHKLTDMLEKNGTALEPKSIISRKAHKIQFKLSEKSSDNIEARQQEKSEPQTSGKQEENQTDSPKTAENTGTKASPTEAEGEKQEQKSAPSSETKNPSAKSQIEKASQTKPTQGGKAEKTSIGDNGEKASVSSEEATDAQQKGETGAKAPTSPEEDPAFQGVVTKSKKVTQQQKEHPPATKEAKEAQVAAVAPPNEVDSKAQTNQVGEMQGAKTPGFDAAAFKAKLMKRIAEMAPKNLEEADNFKDNNQLDGVKQELGGQVNEEKQKSQGELEEKTQETPNTSGIEAKQVNPLPPQEPGAEPGNINAEQAAPKEKGQEEVEVPLQNSSKEIDQKLAENNVTEQQLAKSNEPQFIQSLEAKKTAQTHAKEAPKTYRQSEQNQIAQAQGEAAVLAQEKLQGMRGDRLKGLEQVTGNQLTGKSNDEQARSKVAGEINAIYEDTKVNVEKILSELDSEVGNKFDSAAEEGKTLFENYVGKKMDAYKDERYSGFWGPGKWLKDKLFGMPSEVNKFYEEGKKLYLDKMDKAIDSIVNFIGTKLTTAKQEVAKGKQKIQDYVNQLPQDLKAVGTEAAADIQSRFDELEQNIDSKQDELIDTLAQKYQDNLQAIDTRIEEMKEANKGLVQKAIDFVVEVVGTIVKMAALLAKALARAASAIPDILKDPIGFLGNLISALKQGFLNFMNNIGKHLQKGLLGWLTGAIASGGIQIPNKLDLSGIFSLVVQLLGMGYDMIRGRAVKKLGEEKVSKLEQSFEIFQILANQGVQGLWQFVKDKLGDLKAMVLDPIRDFIIENVIKAGITWILSLLNPASAFVKACQAIYQIVMFFIERAEQIADFINAIINAVMAIAGGAIGDAIKGVENALAKALPLVISFLARLLGLGNIAGKVQDILRKLRKPIVKAIDWILDKAVKFARKIGGKFGKKGKKGKKNKDAKTDEAISKQKPDKRKKAAKKKFISLMKAKKTMSKEEMNRVFVKLKTQFKLSDIKLEGNQSNPKIGFYASPATFVPVMPMNDPNIVPGQKPGATAANRPSVKAGDYIKPQTYDGPFSTPGKQVVDRLNQHFQGKSISIGQNTGNGGSKKKSKILKTIPAIVPSTLPLYTQNNNNTYRRAGTVEAKSSVTRGQGRSGSGETIFGHFGADEEKIKTGSKNTNYNGGHLVGDQIMDSRQAFNLYEDWNLAPQARSFNSPIYTGNIENSVTKAINAGASIKYTVRVQYPNDNYQISASELVKNLLPKNDSYRKMVEDYMQNNPDPNLTLTRRTPGFWQATAKVVAGGKTIKSGNINARENVAFENNPVNVQPVVNYQPVASEQVRYTLELDPNATLNPATGPTPKNPMKYTGATQVTVTARQETF